MTRSKVLFIRLRLGMVVSVFVSLLPSPAIFAASAPMMVESLDQLYEKAKKEGGRLTIYAALSAKSMEAICRRL